MNPTVKRSLLYGGATAALVAIAVGSRFVQTDADVMTLLSSADVQLRLAYGIPAVGKDGKPLADRQLMIEAAEQHLATVERLQPGMASTAEFQGFAHSLQGRFTAAAACYARARGCADVQAEQADVLAFNEARMLAQGGQLEQALGVFARHAATLDSRFGAQRGLEEAAILRRLGRTAEAVERLDAVRNDGAAAPVARLQAGVEYMHLGRMDAAEALLTGIAGDVPIACYHLARLKLQQGDVDSSLDLLERANRAAPAEVRRQLSQETDAWSAVAMHARFQVVSGSRPAAPAR